MADKEIQSYADLTPSDQTKVFGLNPGDVLGWVDFPEDAQTPADVASAVSAHDADQNAHATIQASVTVAQNAAAAAQADATQALADAATAGGGTATHIADPDDAHAASAISVADAGSHFAGAEVEAALQDLAGRSDTAAAAIATNTSDLTTKADITDVANDIDTHDNDPTAHNGIAATVSEKVTKSGDTMTGPLLLSGAPTTDLEAATKKYVDDNAGGGTGSPPYDDTQVKADIATNTADIAAVAQASLQGDAGLDVRVATLENAGGSGYDDTAVKADIASNTAAIATNTADIAAIPADGVPAGGLTGMKLAKVSGTDFDAAWGFDPPAGEGNFGVTRLATAAEVAAGTATDRTVTPATLADVLPWSGTQAEYDAIAVKDPNRLYAITS